MDSRSPLDLVPGGLAHALASPLHAARAEVELALDELRERPSADLSESPAALERCLAGLGRLESLVHTLRDLDRPAQERPELCQPLALLEQAIAWVQATEGPETPIALRSEPLPLHSLRVGASLRLFVRVLRAAAALGATRVECAPAPGGFRIRVHAAGELAPPPASSAAAAGMVVAGAKGAWALVAAGPSSPTATQEAS